MAQYAHTLEFGFKSHTCAPEPPHLVEGGESEKEREKGDREYDKDIETERGFKLLMDKAKKRTWPKPKSNKPVRLSSSQDRLTSLGHPNSDTDLAPRSSDPCMSLPHDNDGQRSPDRMQSPLCKRVGSAEIPLISLDSEMVVPRPSNYVQSMNDLNAPVDAHDLEGFFKRSTRHSQKAPSSHREENTTDPRANERLGKLKQMKALIVRKKRKAHHSFDDEQYGDSSIPTTKGRVPFLSLYDQRDKMDYKGDDALASGSSNSATNGAFQSPFPGETVNSSPTIQASHQIPEYKDKDGFTFTGVLPVGGLNMRRVPEPRENTLGTTVQQNDSGPLKKNENDNNATESEAIMTKRCNSIARRHSGDWSQDEGPMPSC
eukprot:Ihof_evm9s69 gene=Ihof_evmTU9s69